MEMRELTYEEYKKFLNENNFVIIGKNKIKLHKKWKIKEYSPREDYSLEGTTVWSFPQRGRWATHIGNFRGNFSPYIPRNLILKYTNPGDYVLDQMVGSGTTLIECKLLGRNGIGVDINPNCIILTRNRLDFEYFPHPNYKEPIIKTYVGDAKNLNLIPNESIDLIVTHPPYFNIIGYSEGEIEGDLSKLKFEDYIKAIKEIAQESFRVLKENKYCAILIGDTRKHKHYVPLAYRVMEKFLEVGFTLKEDIIKLQHNVTTNRTIWRKKYYDFYKIMHEHIFVFRKPKRDEKPLKLSSFWKQ